MRFDFSACVCDLTGVGTTERLERGAGSIAVRFVMVLKKEEKEAPLEGQALVVCALDDLPSFLTLRPFSSHSVHATRDQYRLLKGTSPHASLSVATRPSGQVDCQWWTTGAAQPALKDSGPQRSRLQNREWGVSGVACLWLGQRPGSKGGDYDSRRWEP